jgi:hypothetical protein
MEIELRKLTDTQRAARLLEIARVSKMGAMVQTAYKLNKLPLQPISKPWPHSSQYIAYVIGISYVLFCAYFLIGFGVRRGADVTNAWLVSMLASLLETMIISWPTTIFFLNVLLPRLIQPIIGRIDISEEKELVAQNAGNLDAQVQMGLEMNDNGKCDADEVEDFDVHDDNWLADFGEFGEIFGSGMAAAAKSTGFASSRTKSEKALTVKKKKKKKTPALQPHQPHSMDKPVAVETPDSVDEPVAAGKDPVETPDQGNTSDDNPCVGSSDEEHAWSADAAVEAGDFDINVLGPEA